MEVSLWFFHPLLKRKGFLAMVFAALMLAANSASAAFSFSVANYAAGTNLQSVAVGDFNGDGKPDLVASNVSVLLGNGDGTFAAAVNYSAGTTPTFVAVGDFNGDGKLDLAVTNGNSNNVSILLGNGDGTFAAAVNYSVGTSPQFVAVGDFNGDGKPDLVVANVDSNNVSILLGNGDGTFAAAVNRSVGTTPRSVVVGDFNSDGKSDLAVVNANSNNVSLLLGNGDGTFAAAVNHTVGTYPCSVAAGDFNGDGKPDLAVANCNSSNVSLLIGNGDGTFAATVNYSVGSWPHSVAVGDFDGDGKKDLVVANANSNNVSLLLGNGDGTFAAAVNHAAGTYPYSAAVSDFNGDGKPDLAVANGSSANNISILLNIVPPGAPTGVSASGGNAQATVGFTAPVSTGGSAITGYTVTSSPASGVDSDAGTTATTHTVTGLTNGTAYTFTVTAANAAGTGAASTASSAVTPKANQTVSFGTTPSVVVGGTGSVSASATSGLAVSYTSTTTGVCTVSGSTVTGVTASTCTIVADQGGNASYNAAPQATQNITVGKANQTVSFGAAPSVVVGGTGSVSATATSGLAATYTSTTTGVCTVSGSTVTGVTAGTCTIAANQGGNANYNAAPQVTQNITVGKANQTVSFGATPSVAVGGTGSVSASATSGLAVSYTSTTTGVCTISGSTVTGVTAGTCTIAANQAGNANYNAATQVTQNITIGTATASVALASSANPADLGQSVTFTATVSGASPTGTVTFKDGGSAIVTCSGVALSGGGAACTKSDLVAGSHSITADYSGDGNNAAASSSAVSQFIADRVPDAFSFTNQTGAALNTATESNAITVTGTNAAATVSVSGGQYAVSTDGGTNWGGFTASGGTVNLNDRVKLRVTSANASSTAASATLTIGGVAATFTVTTAADNTPDAFSFTNQSGLARNAVVESNIVTLGGIDSGTAISVSGGEYAVSSDSGANWGSYTASAGTVAGGAQVRLRVTASNLFLTGVTATLTVGSASASFTATTEAEDTTPSAFSFPAQSDVARSTQIESATITLNGINSSAGISVSGGEYAVSADGGATWGAYTATSGSASNGQVVKMRVLSSASFATAASATLTIGGVAGTFEATTLAQDTTPSAFSFTAQTGAALSAAITSNTITVTGINSAAAISIVGGSYAINGGAYTSAAGTVNSGDTVTAQLTSSASHSTLTTATATIGGVVGTFDVTTLAAAPTPAPSPSPAPVYTPPAAPSVINAPSAVDTTLTGATPVNAAPGSTLTIPAGAAVSGVAITLAAPVAGVAVIPVTINVGGNTLTVTPTGADTVVTLKNVTINGVSTPVLAVSSGAVTVGASSAQPLLIMANNGGVIAAGTGGSTISQSMNADGTATLSVTGGSVVLPTNAFAAANGFAAIKDGKLYAGEIVQIDAGGKVDKVRLGSLAGAAVGDPIKTPVVAGLTLNATITNLKGKVARLSATQDFIEVIAASVGAGYVPKGQNSHGVLSFSVSGVNANALPVGDISVDTSRADGMTTTGNSRVEVVKDGVIVSFVPTVTDPAQLATQVIALDKNAALAADEYGVIRASLNGATYAVQPGWAVDADGGAAGFGVDALGYAVYRDGSGNRQTLYPAFIDLGQIIVAFKPTDANVSATGNADGTITAKYLGVTYTLMPDYLVLPLPAAHAKDAWWLDGAKVYVRSSDGKTAQGFAVK